MLRTRLTEMLGIEHPVIGKCMQWISGPEFAAAVSEAGGLGVMSSGHLPHPRGVPGGPEENQGPHPPALRREPQPLPRPEAHR